MASLVHLITLGWISTSILGALYVVGPLAMRLPMRGGALDVTAFACMTIGTAGMVGHFWEDRYSGMPHAAVLVVAAFALVALRLLPRLTRARVQNAVKLHLFLAFGNILAAGVLGFLLSLDKSGSFLPSSGLTHVYAHAHLAAIGWACMVVAGVGYRLLPMVLPSAMPQGRSLYASALLLEAGSAGLFVAFLAGGRWMGAPALCAAAGLGAFLWHVGWMRRNPRRRPAALPTPDLGTLQALSSLIYLLAAGALGIYLSFAPVSEATLKLGGVYGVLGLVGFLSQMVAGIGGRLLPLFAAVYANANIGTTGQVIQPYRLASRNVQAAATLLWAAGVPALAAALYAESPAWISASAWALLAATALGTWNTARVLRRAYR